MYRHAARASRIDHTISCHSWTTIYEGCIFLQWQWQRSHWHHCGDAYAMEVGTSQGAGQCMDGDDGNVMALVLPFASRSAWLSLSSS